MPSSLAVALEHDVMAPTAPSPPIAKPTHPSKILVNLNTFPLPSFSNFVPQPVLACLSYITCSTSLTLANKHIFSSNQLDYPWMILAVQSAFVYILLLIFLLYNRRPVFNTQLFRQMLLPCFLFTFYIFTNSQALRTVSLPILSVLKSLAPMGLALAEKFIFGDRITIGVAVAMLLIIFGNTITVINDIEFSTVAYMWAFMNIILNIVHVLSLRACLSDIYTPIEKTLHSNLIAGTIMIPLAFASGEVLPFFREFETTTLSFRYTFALSSVLCVGIGASVFWVVQTTSGSTLSFVGACNKFLVVILGAILFDSKVSPMGWVSVLFGVSAGVVFAVEKAKAKRLPSPEQASENPRHVSRLNVSKEDIESKGDGVQARHPT